MKKPVLISLCVMTAFLFCLPLFAGEQLMTRLFFDNWLQKATSPLEERIRQLQSEYAGLEEAARRLRSEACTEIKVIVGQTTAYLEGQPIPIDAAPIISNGRTMVPVRFIGEAFGAKFSWDEKTRRVTYTIDGLKIELTIGKTEVKVNEKSGSIDAAPVIVNGRTMVPIRFIGQYMDASFEWDGERQAVTIFR